MNAYWILTCFTNDYKVSHGIVSRDNMGALGTPTACSFVVTVPSRAINTLVSAATLEHCHIIIVGHILTHHHSGHILSHHHNGQILSHHHSGQILSHHSGQILSHHHNGQILTRHHNETHPPACYSLQPATHSNLSLPINTKCVILKRILLVLLITST